MSEQVPTKDQVSLDDLKFAIQSVPPRPDAILSDGESLSEWQSSWVEYRERQSEAWRTAFEWREGWHDRLDNAQSSPEAAGLVVESLEGMDLIREKLR